MVTIQFYLKQHQSSMIDAGIEYAFPATVGGQPCILVLYHQIEPPNWLSDVVIRNFTYPVVYQPLYSDVICFEDHNVTVDEPLKFDDVVSVNRAVVELFDSLCDNPNVLGTNVEVISGQISLIVYTLPVFGACILGVNNKIPTEFIDSSNRWWMVCTKHDYYQAFYHDKHYEKIPLGCEIGLVCDKEECPLASKPKLGTLGCFVKLEEQIYALTCGHVLTFKEGRENHTHQHNEKTCITSETDDFQIIIEPEKGIDLGLIKISSDLSISSKFMFSAKSQHWNCLQSKIIKDKSRKLTKFLKNVDTTTFVEEFPVKEIKQNFVYKIGRTTGITQGCLRNFKCVVRPILTLESKSFEYKWCETAPELKGLVQVRSRGISPAKFGDSGDSGAVVWVDGEWNEHEFTHGTGNVTGIGVLLGGLKNTDTAFFTPISSICERFGESFDIFVPNS